MTNPKIFIGCFKISRSTSSQWLGYYRSKEQGTTQIPSAHQQKRWRQHHLQTGLNHCTYEARVAMIILSIQIQTSSIIPLLGYCSSHKWVSMLALQQPQMRYNKLPQCYQAVSKVIVELHICCPRLPTWTNCSYEACLPTVTLVRASARIKFLHCYLHKRHRKWLSKIGMVLRICKPLQTR